MSEVGRSGGYGSGGNRREQRAIEDLDRERLRIRRALRKVSSLQVNATLADVIRVLNDIRRVLVD